VVGDDDAARQEVSLAGFSSYDLSYQSSGHRYANRRGRLRNDLAMLVGYGAATASVEGQRVVTTRLIAVGNCRPRSPPSTQSPTGEAPKSCCRASTRSPTRACATTRSSG
jgi:hypothetical protein